MKYNEETKKWESPYWHPAVTTDSVVFGFDGEELNLLLIQRGEDPYAGMWALPGGFMLPDDKTAKDAAYRELHEETNVEGIYMEELQTFSDINRDTRERVITIAFFALVVKDRYVIKGGDDAKMAKWFPVNDLPELAFDHNLIIDTALERLKMLKLGYIKYTGKKDTGNPYRSPKLYTFDEEAYATAKKIGMRLEF